MNKHKRDEQYFDEQAEWWWGRFETWMRTMIMTVVVFLPFEVWNKAVPGMPIDWHWILLYLIVHQTVTSR